MTIDEARALWSPSGPYLNTASYGLPPQPAWDAMQQALADWRHGRTRAGLLRASFHVYWTEADVDAALDALIG